MAKREDEDLIGRIFGGGNEEGCGVGPATSPLSSYPPELPTEEGYNALWQDKCFWCRTKHEGKTEDQCFEEFYAKGPLCFACNSTGKLRLSGKRCHWCKPKMRLSKHTKGARRILVG